MIGINPQADLDIIFTPANAPAVATRRTDLDALRSFAMLLGVALHAAMSFVPFPWPVRDTQRSDVLLLLIGAVHGFRMPLFFLLSGYFTMLVHRRRGLASLLEQRFMRIFLPLVIATLTIVPLDKVIERYALPTNRPEPALAGMLSGDKATVRRLLATPGAAERQDAFWGLAPLAWATMRGDPGIVAAVLDAGGDPGERDRGGNTPLHHAAYFGRDAAARLLLERGADPAAVNAVGRMPAAMASLPAELVSELAPLTSMNPVAVDEVLAGRERLRALLPTGPNPEGTLGGPLDRATLAWSRILSADWLRLRIGSWSLHLVQTNVFHHLWFLWFLCWLVAAFAILAVLGLLPTGRGRWWLVAASCVPQLVMGMSMGAGYGPDSSFGILPRPHLLAFYACFFFFFGVAAFAAEGLDTRLGRHWKLLLPAAIVLFVIGIATLNDRPLASVLQPAFAWTMSLGLIGLFSRFCSRPSPLVSWLADASYWMYLVHVPLVMAAQLVVRPWAMPADVKFLLVMALVTPVLLVSYRYGVRHTAIGRLLNGPRGVSTPLPSPAFRSLLAGGLLAAGPAAADEGMWLFNDLPKEQLRETHGIAVTDEWAERLMKSCVRFNVGGSASFISSNGLVLTNHHVGSDTLFKLSTPERNILEDGFLARTTAEELAAPDLELNQLVAIRDVTAEVTAAVPADLAPERAVAARRAVIARIEEEASDETGLRCNVITLYGGGRYHLYQFKKYTDVRLVWAPEAAIAFFGGDADNFEYPRYNLDACIFRVYEEGRPARIEHFLRWSADGSAEGELTFVAGNPGRTSRILTVAALKFQRDRRVPFVLDALCRREIALQQFSLAGPEAARRAKDELFGVQNSRKVTLGRLQGLQDPAIFAAKEEAERALLAQVKADPRLAPSAAAWDRIAEIQKRRAETLGKNAAPGSQLFGIAKTIVQLVAEDQKPSQERLPEYAAAGRASLEQQLYSEAPIYPDLEQMLLAESLTRMIELRGADDPVCVAMLCGKAPLARAAELVAGTALASVAARRALVASGPAGVGASTDPLIALARELDPDIRRHRQVSDELDELERQAYAEIATAIFATRGTAAYPDATFSLRLAFGAVKGYEEDGRQVPAWTDFGGAFAHELAHAGQELYSLPPSWHAAKERLDLATPFNFVSTADIIGGNSGSPVVNKDLELVGLIFDGNIQSLTADYVYSDAQSRAVSVHSSAIREALRQVYGAQQLVEQLGK